MLKYSFKTKLPLSIKYCSIPQFYYPLCLANVHARVHTERQTDTQTDRHTHTPHPETDYFQGFLGSLVYWEISEKQVLVTEKCMKEGKFICILKFNCNSQQEQNHQTRNQNSRTSSAMVQAKHVNLDKYFHFPSLFLHLMLGTARDSIPLY